MKELREKIGGTGVARKGLRNRNRWDARRRFYIFCSNPELSCPAGCVPFSYQMWQCFTEPCLELRALSRSNSASHRAELVINSTTDRGKSARNCGMNEAVGIKIETAVATGTSRKEAEMTNQNGHFTLNIYIQRGFLQYDMRPPY